MKKTNNYKLFLDDVRTLEETYEMTKNPIYLEYNWVIVRNYHDFINFFNYDFQFLPNVISFDHDLADEHYIKMLNQENNDFGYSYKEKTGYDCLKWLIKHLDGQQINNNRIKKIKFLFHTANPIGRENMENYYKNWMRIRNFYNHNIN